MTQPLSELRLAVGLPSYDGRRHNTLALMSLATRAGYVAPVEGRSSLLAYGFNLALCEAMRMRDSGLVTHFLLLHDDIIPCGEDWMDTLWAEYQSSGAEMLSVVVPFKNESGMTSTAVEGPDKWRPRRLTLAEVHAKGLAKTFTLPGLLLNSGCLFFDLRLPWVDKVWFNISDEIVRRETFAPNLSGLGMRTLGPTFSPRVESEDWAFTRMARANGCERVFATTAVQVLHVGQQMFPNYQVWGAPTDDGK